MVFHLDNIAYVRFAHPEEAKQVIRQVMIWRGRTLKTEILQGL